jgi:hypothetical protein
MENGAECAWVNQGSKAADARRKTNNRGSSRKKLRNTRVQLVMYASCMTRRYPVPACPTVSSSLSACDGCGGIQSF